MSAWERVNLESARGFLDFAGARPADLAPIASAQLEGAVALYNRLAERHLAWLADEVGMGKTYVALGVAALLKRQNPQARILIVVPSSRLQQKWLKEIGLFTSACVQQRDGRARGADDLPARPIVQPGSLYEMGRAMLLDADRDMLVTMSSFSFGLANAEENQRADYRDTWHTLASLSPQLGELPAPEVLGDKHLFKRAYASALNRLLPLFDLVICDEAHNLRAGVEHDAARNLTMAAALGGSADSAQLLHCPTPAQPRVARLLCMTATPAERDYEELSRQAQVFGLDGSHPTLPDGTKSDLAALRQHPAPGEEDRRKEIARRYVLRRIQSLQGPSGGESFTKNQYRREWREGGVSAFDQPMAPASDYEKLVIALLQKRVVETLHESGQRKADGVFLPSFQMGMLASFESFSETIASRTRQSPDKPDAQVFEGKAQGAHQDERQGIDSEVVDRLCRDYRQRFRSAPPHPKMDQVAQEAARLAIQGDKSLIFVRRVRSTTELAGKITEHLDRDLLAYMQQQLPKHLQQVFRFWRKRWEEACRRVIPQRMQPPPESSMKTHAAPVADKVKDIDTGDASSFFAWFFRGTGDAAHQVGAKLRKDTFSERQHAWSVFFQDNHVLWLFGDDEAKLDRWAHEHERDLRIQLARRMEKDEKRGPRHIFDAWQAAALALLAEQQSGTPVGLAAAQLLDELYPSYRERGQWEGAKAAGLDWLLRQTFFSRLRRSDLAESLWPGAAALPGNCGMTLREREERRELMASTLRLGSPYVDVWLSAVRLLRRFNASNKESKSAAIGVAELADALIDRLRLQRDERGGSRQSWHELELLARNHALLVNVNFADLHKQKLSALPLYFSHSLGRQSPVLAVHGGSKNDGAQTQFRMPGYPMVLVATDVLQEGVDLHTFCARVMHYGIAPTSSSTEQRTGRVDRIGGLVHRRFDPENPATLLQVHYPHLRDSIEPLQIAELYRRMAVSLRLMHEGLGGVESGTASLDLGQAMLRELCYPRPPTQHLESAFKIRTEGADNDLHGGVLTSAVLCQPDLARLDADIRALVMVDDSAKNGSWTGYFPVGGSQVSASSCAVRLELRARRDGQGAFLRVIADAGQMVLQDGGAVAQLQQWQSLLVGATVAASWASAALARLEVRCDVTLPPCRPWQHRLRTALEAVSGQSRTLQTCLQTRRSLMAIPTSLSDIRADVMAADGISVLRDAPLSMTLMVNKVGQRIDLTVVNGWYRVEAAIGETHFEALAVLLLGSNDAMELVNLAWRDGVLIARQDLPACADGAELTDSLSRVARVAAHWRKAWVGGAG